MNNVRYWQNYIYIYIYIYIRTTVSTKFYVMKVLYIIDENDVMTYQIDCTLT